jgi:hypothetical protein
MDETKPISEKRAGTIAYGSIDSNVDRFDYLN